MQAGADSGWFGPRAQYFPVRSRRASSARILRRSGAALVLLFTNLAGGSSAAGRRQTLVSAHAGTAGAVIADSDIMPNIHFSDRLRRSSLGKLPDEPNLDVSGHQNWAEADEALKKNEEQIYEDIPRFIRTASECPFPVVGNMMDIETEFWAFGESMKVSKVDQGVGGRSMGRTQLGRVKTSFWNWGSHWMRTGYEWRDPSSERVIASSSGGAQSWYHNTVEVFDCEGEKLAYIKFKLGANAGRLHGADAQQDYIRITVHDLVGNEVAVAFTPREGLDGSDWRHRRIVVHDRNSGMKMVEISQLGSDQDWRISFEKGSEVLGGLGSDPRVIVMLVASRDAAAQFGLASIPMWPFVVACFILIFFCIWCNIPNLQKLYGYKEIPDDSAGQMPSPGTDAFLGGLFQRGKKVKVDDLQPDGDVPMDQQHGWGQGFGGWLRRGGDTEMGGDASAPDTWRNEDENTKGSSGADAGVRTSWMNGDFLRNWNPFGGNSAKKEDSVWA